MAELNPIAVFFFAGFKGSFYLLAGYWLGQLYGLKSRAAAFALTRMLCGLALGLLLIYLSRQSATVEAWSPVLVLTGRLVQWAALLAIFFDPRLQHRARLVALSVVGTLYSFLLDVPALLLALFGGLVPVC